MVGQVRVPIQWYKIPWVLLVHGWQIASFHSLVYIAYLFPLMIAYRLWCAFRLRHNPMPFDGLLFTLRALGLLMVVIAGTGLFAIQTLGETSVLPFSSGGLLGIAIAEALEKGLGFVGATLLFLAVGLFGFTIYTDLSWIRLVDSIGRLSLLLAQQSIRYVSTLASRYIQKKQDKEQVKASVKSRQDSVRT